MSVGLANEAQAQIRQGLPSDFKKGGRVYAIAFDINIEQLRTRLGDPAPDGRVIGGVVGEDHAQQVLDLAGADAHGEGGHRQPTPGGLVESGGRRGGDFGRRRGGGRGLQSLEQPLSCAKARVP